MLLYLTNFGELAPTEFHLNLEEAIEQNCNDNPIYKADVYKSRISISETGKISYKVGAGLFKTLPIFVKGFISSDSE